MSKSEHWRVRLREAVDQTGKKHSFIAEEAGIDPTTLSRILTGKMRPRFDTVVRLTHAAGESVGWLLNERRYDLSARDREILLMAAEIMIRITFTKRDEAHLVRMLRRLP